MKPKLDKQMVFKLKEVHGVTWAELAFKLDYKSSQHLQTNVNNESPLLIAPFAKLFGVSKVKLTTFK